MAVIEGMRAIDVIRLIEADQGWVYDSLGLRFTLPSATHSADSPDSFGRVTSSERVPLRPRSIVIVQFRFRHLTGGVSLAAVNGAATFMSFSASVPEGVKSAWSNSQQRTYFTSASSPLGSTGAPVLQTSLQTVSAGLILSAIAARLPGGMYRLDGTLEVSSFTGSGLEKAEVTVPLEVDGLLGEWESLVKYSGSDVGASLAFKGLGFAPSATAENIEVQVRVE